MEERRERERERGVGRNQMNEQGRMMDGGGRERGRREWKYEWEGGERVALSLTGNQTPLMSIHLASWGVVCTSCPVQVMRELVGRRPRCVCVCVCVRVCLC